MLRTLLFVSLAACTVTSPDPIDALDPPEPSPPPAEGPPGVFAQLHDDAGDVPGLEGVEREHRGDATRCGGQARDVRITSALGAEDQPLAALLELRFPTQLDFTDANREASMQRFQVFVDDLRARGNTARDHYVGRLDAATEPAGKAAAAGRLVVVHRHLAALLVRAEIPLDVRRGELATEKIEDYCAKMTAVAVPFLAQAREAERVQIRLSP